MGYFRVSDCMFRCASKSMYLFIQCFWERLANGNGG